MPLLFHTTIIADKAIKIDNSVTTLYRSFSHSNHSFVRSLLHATFPTRKPYSNPNDPEQALFKFSKKTQEVEPKPLYVEIINDLKKKTMEYTYNV